MNVGSNFYVYMYLDLVNVPFYVGKGTGDRCKIYKHLWKGHPNIVLRRKILKVGIENVKIHFLHKHLTEEEAFIWEKYWIKYIGRRDKGEGTLCNLTDGGDNPSGHHVTDITKEKIRKALTGRKASVATRKKQSINSKRAMLGKHPSEETRRKMSESAKGKIIPQEVRQKISQTLKGRPSPNKGHKHTAETRGRLRQIRLGQIVCKDE